jgi:hypothetical protein
MEKADTSASEISATNYATSLIQKRTPRSDILTPVTWGNGSATGKPVHLASNESIPYRLSCPLPPPLALCEESSAVLTFAQRFLHLKLCLVYATYIKLSTVIYKFSISFKTSKIVFTG